MPITDKFLTHFTAPTKLHKLQMHKYLLSKYIQVRIRWSKQLREAAWQATRNKGRSRQPQQTSFFFNREEAAASNNLKYFGRSLWMSKQRQVQKYYVSWLVPGSIDASCYVVRKRDARPQQPSQTLRQSPRDSGCTWREEGYLRGCVMSPKNTPGWDPERAVGRVYPAKCVLYF